MKINEMEGWSLDYAVAIALQYTRYPGDSIEKGNKWHLDLSKTPFGRVMYVDDFTPSRCAQGDYIIEKYRISVVWTGEQWGATMHVDNVANGYLTYGPTRLIAAMRTFAGHKLGTKLIIPPEIANKKTSRLLEKEEKGICF